jgi:hypothetical protein
MATQSERLLTALDAEIAKASKLEHELARVRLVLREQVTRLRVGANPELVMATLRQSLPHETTLALIERIDPVLSANAETPSHQPNKGRTS